MTRKHEHIYIHKFIPLVVHPTPPACYIYMHRCSIHKLTTTTLARRSVFTTSEMRRTTRAQTQAMRRCVQRVDAGVNLISTTEHHASYTSASAAVFEGSLSPPPPLVGTAHVDVDMVSDSQHFTRSEESSKQVISPTFGGVPVLDELSHSHGGDTEPAPRKRTRRKKNQTPEQVEYDIPDVEKKETSYHGRLGYACLNTVLRATKPEPIFCSRTCRLDTIAKNGIEHAKNLGLKNIQDLVKLIQWNEENRIRFMRLSSEMFPFASHLKWGYNLEYAAEDLKAAGDLANRLGHRLTVHPGQLASPRPAVVEASVRELEYHNEMLDRMGLGADSVMIIHMGGVYGDKQTTLKRFKENYGKLRAGIKARLVLENDEISYNLDDLVPICEELDIPVVIDYHHDWIKPSSRSVAEMIPIVNTVWERKGIRPKQHLSSPRAGAVTVMEKRAHAHRCHSLPTALPDDMDLMVEAKDKEQAVFQLYRIYGLEPVWEANLRPERVEQEKQ